VGFRLRKSIRLGPGVRLTASHRGASIRVGPRGAGVSASTSGRKTVSAGIPGSGLGYQRSWASRSRGGTARADSTTAPARAAALQKPGWFAPGYEKAFYKAVRSYIAGDTERALAMFRESAAKDVRERSLADDLFAGLLTVQVGPAEAAIPYLEKVVRSDQPLPDQLMQKYAPGGDLTIRVTEHVTVEVPTGSLAAALTLAEIYQRAGRHDEAIGVVQQLVETTADPALVLSLCDLYAQTASWDELIDVAAGITNQDDVSLQIKLYQAQALSEQGLQEAALEALRDALRARKRDPELLLEARYRRARLYLAGGKRSRARKDLERIYAADPDYRDVRDLLNAEA
jgi:tetratricopeptide (TPR) repeat protein